MKSLFIDFDDSFSFNILSDLYSIKIIPDVCHWTDFSSIKNFVDSDCRKLLILGPGPGHPNDYQKMFFLIEKILLDSSASIFGICLGHQILWTIFGKTVSPWKNQKHGETIELVINNEKKVVQKYNSLSVDGALSEELVRFKNFSFGLRNIFSEEGELMASYQNRIVSYQFHPESIGTSCRDELYLPVLQLLYNGSDEYSDQDRWGL